MKLDMQKVIDWVKDGKLSQRLQDNQPKVRALFCCCSLSFCDHRVDACAALLCALPFSVVFVITELTRARR